MAWIDTVPDDRWEDDPDLADLYGRVVDATHGRIDHIMAIHSLNPRGLAAHDGLYGHGWYRLASQGGPRDDRPGGQPREPLPLLNGPPPARSAPAPPR